MVLVDFENDCVRTSLSVARKLGRKLWGVRLDTSAELRDESVVPHDERSLGVCPELVWNVREALDREGFSWVKIVISGGFTAARINEFIKLRVPFDAVGVGSAFLREKIDFTADIVRVNGKRCAKVGRGYTENKRLKRVL